MRRVIEGGYITVRLFLLLSSACVCSAQSQATTQGTSDPAKVMIGSPGAEGLGDMIAIPPETSVRISRNLVQGKGTNATPDRAAQAWLQQQTALNGLESPPISPWHIILQYEQFDDDGDKVNVGTFEQFWVSEKKYRRTYKGDLLNQTDYSTDQGVFRKGDQRWPNRIELQVDELLKPLAGMQGVPYFHLQQSEERFGTHSLVCDSIQVDPGVFNVPRRFCFDPISGALRYVRGAGWGQSVYNQVVDFQGRHVARDVAITDAGKPRLDLKVLTLEQMSSVDDALFRPPPDALRIGEEVTGVPVRTIKTVFPDWPASARGQHFRVVVDLLVGKDGRIETAKAISGPPQCFKAAENAAKQWIFQPYSVQGSPVKVGTKIELSQD